MKGHRGVASPCACLALLYFASECADGTAGEAQFGPASNCVQMVPTGTIKKAIAVTGKKVAECKLVNAKTATLFCDDGGMSEYDIAYIKGKVAKVEAGQGYGCSTKKTGLSIGNAICKVHKPLAHCDH